MARWDHDRDGTLRRCGGSCGRHGGTRALEGFERRGRPKAVVESMCQYPDDGMKTGGKQTSTLNHIMVTILAIKLMLMDSFKCRIRSQRILVTSRCPLPSLKQQRRVVVRIVKSVQLRF